MNKNSNFQSPTPTEYRQNPQNSQPAEVIKQLESLSIKWNCTNSPEFQTMMKCFSSAWDMEKGIANKKALFEKQLSLLQDIDQYPHLRLMCFDITLPGEDFTNLFSSYLEFQAAWHKSNTLSALPHSEPLMEAPHVSQAEYEMLNRLSHEIFDTLYSKIDSSLTALRVNTYNKIPLQFRPEVYPFFDKTLSLILYKNKEVNLIPIWWNIFFMENTNLKKALGSDAKKIVDDFVSYCKLSLNFRNLYPKGSEKNDLELKDYLTKFVPTKDINSHGMALWTKTKLLSSPQIDESLKRRIKLVFLSNVTDPNKEHDTIGHVFVGIYDKANREIVFVIDPWLKYVDTKVSGEKFNSSGFFGQAYDYKQIFNEIADDDYLRKMGSNIAVEGTPYNADEVAAYNQILDKL